MTNFKIWVLAFALGLSVLLNAAQYNDSAYREDRLARASRVIDILRESDAAQQRRIMGYIARMLACETREDVRHGGI